MVVASIGEIGEQGVFLLVGLQVVWWWQREGRWAGFTIVYVYIQVHSCAAITWSPFMT